MKAESLKIEAHSRLSPKLISGIETLNTLIPEYELYYEPFSLNGEKAFFTAICSADLIGFLSFLWVPAETEAELTALVHPNFREQRIFTQMLDAAFEECQKLGIRHLYYLLPPNARSSAKNKSHQYSHSEYLMKLNNSSIYDKNMLNSRLESFNTIYKKCNSRMGTCALIDSRSHETLCQCGLADEDSFTNIYGVETHPDCRRKGLATLLMQCVISDAFNDNPKPLILQVSSRNAAACRLYEKLGFEIVSCADYYSIACPHS